MLPDSLRQKAQSIKRDTVANFFAMQHDNRAQGGISNTMLQVVTIGLIIIIGILVYSEVESALPSPSNTDLSNASSNATSDFADTMDLAPVVLVVLVAALVLAVVQNFRN